MNESFLTRWITVIAVALVACAAGCTMKSQDAPPLTGPSELGTSISVSAAPDILTQDGGSQSLVTVMAYDKNGKPLRNVSLRSEIVVGGVIADFGTLSARSIVTGSDGRATLVYTAPAAPAGPAVDNNTTVSISVTPLGTDYANSLARIATIRLVPPGIVVPPDGLQPYFTFTPSAPLDHQAVLFDACNDPTRAACAPANNPIATYSWNFGDGRSSSGRTTSHAYDEAGTYIVTLRVTDQLGRSGSTTQSVTVSAAAGPTAAFESSPGDPLINQPVNFNGGTSRAQPGHQIVSYAWDFGDGTFGSGQTTSHSYSLPRSYKVILTVTDDTGKTATATGSVAPK
jgi:chitodextrinase